MQENHQVDLGPKAEKVTRFITEITQVENEENVNTDYLDFLLSLKGDELNDIFKILRIEFMDRQTKQCLKNMIGFFLRVYQQNDALHKKQLEKIIQTLKNKDGQIQRLDFKIQKLQEFRQIQLRLRAQQERNLIEQSEFMQKQYKDALANIEELQSENRSLDIQNHSKYQEITLLREELNQLVAKLNEEIDAKPGARSLERLEFYDSSSRQNDGHIYFPQMRVVWLLK